jgi:hypothetical protein
MPDGTPVLDPEDCLVVYREGGRYSVEYHGKVLGQSYVLPPEFRGNATDPDETIVVGKFGGGWVELIVASRSIGSYDLNQIFDLGRGRFIYSKDYRHVAFIEHREDGSGWMNVDGVANRLRGPVDMVVEFRFDPPSHQAGIEYISGGATYRAAFPTHSPVVITTR